MKNKCTVIQINGLGGLLIVGFILACAVAGFLVFPAWCCQHAWNYLASFFDNLPMMNLKQGALLWVIIALISYITMFNKFRVSFVAPKDATIKPETFEEMELLKNLKKEVMEEIEKEKEEISK